jgi:Flp pilus assembly pilin Flp
MLFTLVHSLKARLSREEGQTLVEYALIIALVSVVTMGALTLLQGDIAGVFDDIGTALNPA